MRTTKKRRRPSTPKECLTACVSVGLVDRLRQAISGGIGFGRTVEAALEYWLALPQPTRIQALLGQPCASFSAMVEEAVDQALARRAARTECGP